MATTEYVWADPVTTTLTTTAVPGWTLNGNAVDVYNYLDGTFNQGGKLVLTMNLTYVGGNCGAYQSVLHVGQDNTGFSVYVNGGTHLIVTEKHDTNARHETSSAGAILAEGSNTVVITLQGKRDDNGDPTGIASVMVSVNGGQAQSVDDLSWTTMAWNASDESQRTKYSFGCKAPGWASQTPLQLVSIDNSQMVMTYTASVPVVPEPATGTLSLLALVGLCARRRRK